MDNNLVRKGVALEYATIGWIVLGAIVALAAGAIAGSIVLIGFGLNGIADSVSAVIFLRQFIREREDAEAFGIGVRKSLFAVGITFFLLALFLLHETGSRLSYGERTETSVAGLVLAVMSIVILITLMVMKMPTKSAFDGTMLRYRARKTAVRVPLAFILFLGAGLHLRLGWWWADPVAALLMVPIISFEGWEAIEASKPASKSKITGNHT